MTQKLIDEKKKEELYQFFNKVMDSLTDTEAELYSEILEYIDTDPQKYLKEILVYLFLRYSQEILNSIRVENRIDDLYDHLQLPIFKEDKDDE